MQMNDIRKLPIVLATALFLTGCSTTSTNLTSEVSEQNKEEMIKQEMKEITISKGSKELLASNDNEAEIKEELVCKKVKQIGTHFKKKVCWTRAELEAIRKSTRNSLDEVQSNSMRTKGLRLGESSDVLIGNQ